jgi:ELWxxDGT repeat protein
MRRHRNVATTWSLLATSALSLACGSVPPVSAVAPATSLPPPAPAPARHLFSPCDHGEAYGTPARVPGCTLWITDGTPEGTMPLMENGPANPRRLTTSGSIVFFTAEDDTGRQLWKSDGTPQGTRRVKAIGPGRGDAPPPAKGAAEPITYPLDLVAANGLLFFTVDDGIHGREVWRSDGTADGTVLLHDDSNRCCGPIVAAGRLVYFPRAGDLYRSDGTEAGTFWIGQADSALTAAGDILFFIRDHGLFRADGTVGGTVSVKLDRGAEPVTSFVGVSGTLYFWGGGDLWKTDAGLREIVPVRRFNNTFVDAMIGLGPDLLLSVYHSSLLPSGQPASTNPSWSYQRAEVWRSNGTEIGTTYFADPPYPFARAPRIVSGGLLYFVDLSWEQHYPLWRTDSVDMALLHTFDGPQPVAWAFDDPSLGLFFLAEEAGRYGLWRTNGTREGTTFVKDLPR